MSLDKEINRIVRQAVEDALSAALQDLEQDGEEREITWQEKVWLVSAETRLTLEEVGSVLGLSTRSVRRYIEGYGAHPPLPAAKSVGGIVVRAGDMRQWMRDVEEDFQTSW